MAAVLLFAGLAIGYFFPETPLSASPARLAAQAGSVPLHPGLPGGGTRVPTLADMKQVADTQAAPLLATVQKDPNNVAVLSQLGAIYHISHQFGEAADWYGKAVQADPRNVALRTKLAASLYRSGDVEGAIAQLNQGLSYDPNDANSLFNLGMIRLQGKGDGRGAVAAWQRLLKSNPQLSADRKATVLKLIADVMTSLGIQDAQGGESNHDGHKSRRE